MGHGRDAFGKASRPSPRSSASLPARHRPGGGRERLGVRPACEDMLKPFGGAAEPIQAEAVAEFCRLAPESIADPRKLEAIRELAGAMRRLAAGRTPGQARPVRPLHRGPWPESRRDARKSHAPQGTSDVTPGIGDVSGDRRAADKLTSRFRVDDHSGRPRHGILLHGGLRGRRSAIRPRNGTGSNGIHSLTSGQFTSSGPCATKSPVDSAPLSAPFSTLVLRRNAPSKWTPVSRPASSSPHSVSLASRDSRWACRISRPSAGGDRPAPKRESDPRRLRYAWAAGFSSINVDLVYGLPRQGLLSFTRTVEAVVSMRPDRIAGVLVCARAVDSAQSITHSRMRTCRHQR